MQWPLRSGRNMVCKCISKFSRECPGVVPGLSGLSRDCPEISKTSGELCLRPPKKRATYKQIWPPSIRGTIPRSCLCLLAFRFPTKNSKAQSVLILLESSPQTSLNPIYRAWPRSDELWLSQWEDVAFSCEPQETKTICVSPKRQQHYLNSSKQI